LSLGEAKLMSVERAQKSFPHPADRLISVLDVQLIGQLTRGIKQIEKLVLPEALSTSLPRKVFNGVASDRVSAMTGSIANLTCGALVWSD